MRPFLSILVPEKSTLHCFRNRNFVVAGDMLRETIETSESPVGSRDVVEEKSEVIRSGRLYSPAVTLGNFVLTGWSGSDL